ncbi:MAG: tyrosine-type recombinase/integrase [Acidobacteriaceae bacterium]
MKRKPKEAASSAPVWKTEAAKVFKEFDAAKSATAFQRFIKRLDDPCIDALAKEIGTEHMIPVLHSCFFAAPESNALFESVTPTPPDAYDMRAAARKATALAKLVAKHEFGNAEFMGALNSFSLRMDEEAISFGQPQKRAGGYAYGGILLPRPQGKGRRITSEVWSLVKTLERYFRQNLKVAKLREVPFHALRHTYASLLIANGESLAYVKEQMGHHSIQITVDVYGHLIPGANRQAVNRLDDPSWREKSGKSATLPQPGQEEERKQTVIQR